MQFTSIFPAAPKIELFVGAVPDGAHGLPEHAQFTRLGYISFTNNEQTGFRVSVNWVWLRWITGVVV